MARTESTMLDLGTPAPHFRLHEPVTGKTISLSDPALGGPLLVAFICNHCPFVIHIMDAFVKVVREYQPKGVSVVAINSNDVANYPADSPERMIEEAAARGYTFPYLYDESQDVAKSYHAACTPDFYLFDEAQKLVYRGRFDASRPGNNEPVTGADLRAALESVLAGQPAAEEQHASMGCGIKWKSGNAPAYFG
jgi:thiol-disulfide isomerase/thioredoxin